MAGIEYKPTMKKEELLKIAAENGVEVNDDMAKSQIIAALEALNTEQGDEEEGDNNGDAEQSGAEDGGGSVEGDKTTPAEKPAESEQKAPQGYDLFVYAGPSLPRGRLKENSVFRGTFEDVKAHLADVLEDYPQIERLIIPANKLAAFSVKVKTPGNIAHKYYSDIVSAMRGSKEV